MASALMKSVINGNERKKAKMKNIHGNNERKYSIMSMKSERN